MVECTAEYFSRWRLFPRAFISMYIYLLWDVVTWFMELPDPNMNQAGLVSVIVGAGAAWFGLYVNSNSTKYEQTTSTIPTVTYTNEPSRVQDRESEPEPKKEIKSRY